MLVYLAMARQEVGRVGGLWMHARGHKGHHNRPGGGQVAGKIGQYDFKLFSDGQIALKSISLYQSHLFYAFIWSSQGYIFWISLIIFMYLYYQGSFGEIEGKTDILHVDICKLVL